MDETTYRQALETLVSQTEESAPAADFDADAALARIEAAGMIDLEEASEPGSVCECGEREVCDVCQGVDGIDEVYEPTSCFFDPMPCDLDVSDDETLRTCQELSIVFDHLDNIAGFGGRASDLIDPKVYADVTLRAPTRWPQALWHTALLHVAIETGWDLEWVRYSRFARWTQGAITAKVRFRIYELREQQDSLRVGFCPEDSLRLRIEHDSKSDVEGWLRRKLGGMLVAPRANYEAPVGLLQSINLVSRRYSTAPTIKDWIAKQWTRLRKLPSTVLPFIQTRRRKEAATPVSAPKPVKRAGS